MHLIKPVCTGLLLTLLAGCTGATARSPIPQDGAKLVDTYRNHSAEVTTMKDHRERLNAINERALLPGAAQVSVIESQHDHSNDADTAYTVEQGVISPMVNANESEQHTSFERELLGSGGKLYADYMRTAQNEIEVLFPRLPNPDIQFFIYPHLATHNNVPVPGYATVIPLYEKVEYALPGESANFQ